MSESMFGLKKTHGCGEVTVENEGQKIVLMGWVQRRRDHGGVIFVDLRDRSDWFGYLEISKESFQKQKL